MAGKLSNLRLNQGVNFAILYKFPHISVDKTGQRFGVVCQTEMSANRNSFAAFNPHKCTSTEA